MKVTRFSVEPIVLGVVNKTTNKMIETIILSGEGHCETAFIPCIALIQ